MSSNYIGVAIRYSKEGTSLISLLLPVPDQKHPTVEANKFLRGMQIVEAIRKNYEDHWDVIHRTSSSLDKYTIIRIENLTRAVSFCNLYHQLWGYANNLALCWDYMLILAAFPIRGIINVVEISNAAILCTTDPRRDLELAGGTGNDQVVQVCVVDDSTRKLIFDIAALPYARITKLEDEIQQDDGGNPPGVVHRWAKAHQRAWDHIDAETVIFGPALHHPD
ncbi:hypothetical protein BO71DRAFT_431582 [Aspergillus ellipticus CBS 707.79]|uniref:Uncharacterized protein n=1 Tax=Aspergillus ellipticus CBS 707.79 TaxID=1448320 RepID=A0A319DF12_9EURO|nr:hypothetical protein BO71DRAFT_431582 [Aspergillus ellipticus CBS 707.79]